MAGKSWAERKHVPAQEWALSTRSIETEVYYNKEGQGGELSLLSRSM